MLNWVFAFSTCSARATGRAVWTFLKKIHNHSEFSNLGVQTFPFPLELFEPPLSRTSAAYVPQIPSSNRISAPGADRILWQAGFLSPALQVPTAFPLRSKAFRFGSKKPEHWTIDLL